MAKQTSKSNAVAAVAKLVEILTPLPAEDRTRAISAATILLGESGSSRSAVGFKGEDGGSGLQGGARAQASYSIAGQRLEFNHYTLDGVENTDPNFNSYIIQPSVDFIQEFKVQTGVYSAEFGRATSQIGATTKSGTNQYHS